MSSLITCIRKAGKALSASDAAAIREIRDDLMGGDVKAADANQQAVSEYLEMLASERVDLVKSVEAAGGVFPTDDVTTAQFFNVEETIAESTTEEVSKELDLRFKIEDDFIEGLVDKHSEHPQAQLSKLGALVEEINQQAEQPKAVEIWEKTKDISRNATLASVPQSKLNEFIRNGMRGVGDYIRTMKRMDGFINERLEGQAEIGAMWRQMFKDDPKGTALMGEIMHEATRAGADPSKPFVMPASFDKMKGMKRREWTKRKRDHGILSKAWNRLSPEAQSLYEQVRDDYAGMRVEVLKGLERRIRDTKADDMAKAKLIAELRTQFEAGKIEPYFPLARFGKHWATARDRKSGEVIAFSKFENRAERNAWVKEMRTAGYNSFASEESKSDLDNVKRIDPTFVARIADMVDDKNIQDEIWQMYLRSLPERSARTAYIHRQGRLGYAGDALRSYGFHMFHGTHQLGKLNYGFQLQSHLDGLQNEARELISRVDRVRESLATEGMSETHKSLMESYPQYRQLFGAYKGSVEGRMQKAIDKFVKQAEVDAPWARPLADEMSKRHEYNMNPTSSVWATNLTSFGFFWFLSTSPAAGILNLTQTAIVGLPTLGARFGGFGKAAGALGKASVQLAKTRGDLKNTLRGDERKAFEEFDRIGMFEKTRVRDLTGYAERGQDFASKWQGAIDLTSWIFHRTEKWNREVTAIAAYRLSREAGRSHDAAILEAEEMVEMSHFDYTNTNRPRFMQKDAARVVLLFRNYSLNMTYRLVRDFKDGVMRNPNVDVEVRKEAAKRLTGIIGSTFMFAGLTGMPLAWAVHGIIDAVLGSDDEPFDSYAALRAHLTDIWGETAATFIMKGGWDTATGATLSSRASLNNLWIREVPDSLSGKEWVQHILTEAAGPMAGIVVNYAEAAENLDQGHVSRGLEKMAPKFLSDALKTIRYASEGALNYDRDVVLSPEEFTNRDLFIQAMGFTPTRLSTQYEQQRAIKDTEGALTRRRSNLMNSLFLAAKLGDNREMKDVIVRIGKFNKANPSIAITTSGIMQSAKVRAAYDARTINGTAVSKNLHFLHEQYRFTDKKDDSDE